MLKMCHNCQWNNSSLYTNLSPKASSKWSKNGQVEWIGFKWTENGPNWTEVVQNGQVEWIELLYYYYYYFANMFDFGAIDPIEISVANFNFRIWSNQGNHVSIYIYIYIYNWLLKNILQSGTIRVSKSLSEVLGHFYSFNLGGAFLSLSQYRFLFTL